MGRHYPIFLAIIILLTGIRASAQPVISSFTPAKGPVGSIITITGSNFNPTPASNFVYFGPVRGGVMSGTTTSLVVNVPGGTSNDPVSVFDFTTKLTGFANKPFGMTFNGNSTFTSSSFTRKDFPAVAINNRMAVADITLDQKPDLIVSNGTALSFTVMQNTSTTANPAFVNVSFPVAATGNLIGIVSADFDGDGRKDVAVANHPEDRIVVFRNETPGAGPVAFGSKSELTTTRPYDLMTADFDLDGRIDLAASNLTTGTISIFRNITTGVVIAFAPPAEFAVGSQLSGPEIRGLGAGDLDGDGKVDIVTCNLGSGTISILRNTTSGSIISFAAKDDRQTGGGPEAVAFGDLDDDGKLDLAIANNVGGTLSVFRNASSAGSIDFAPKLDLPVGINAYGVGIADLNGDGKADIGVSNRATPVNGIFHSISLFCSTSTPGILSFQPKRDYDAIQIPRNLIMTDFDLDGRLDLATGSNFTDKVTVLLNNATNVPPCTATAAISGQACIGSVLNVSSNLPINSVSWLLNGNVVAVHNAGLQTQSTLVAGGNGSGSGLNQLSSPNRLYVDNDGVLYIPDMANNRVVKWLPGATAGTVIAGGNGAGNQANQFNKPTCVAVDAMGNIYVADQNNNRVQKWAPGATSGTTVASSLGMPTGIFIDAQNNLYVAEQGQYRVRKFASGSSAGVIVAGGNGQGSGANQLASPTGLYVDPAGNLFICDTDNNRVQKWAPGATSGVTVANGSALAHPLGVYVDPEGNLYLSDYTSGNVQKWTPGASSGIIIIDGSSNMGAIKPQGLWMDSNNSLYITDFTQHRVLKFENIFTGSYTVAKAGTYSAQVASSAGCAITTNTIIVAENPIADLKIASNSSIICAAVTPVFTASISSTGSAPLFQWKINGSNSGPLSASTSFSPTGLKVGDKITCEVSLTNSCGYFYQATGNTIIMTDVPQGSPSMTITASASEFCAGTEVTFSSLVSNAGSSPSFQWMRNGQAIAGATSATYISKLFLSGDKITCEVTSNEQCQTNAKSTSNEVVLKVNPIVTPEITIQPDVTAFYENTNATFTATVLNGGNSPLFDWQINGQTVATNKTTFTTKDLAEGDQVSCVLTSNASCISTATVTSNIIDITITPVLTIKPPTVFTPNGDAVNDTWEIPGISAFPGNIVVIYNQYGTKVFASRGYQTPWKGEYRGRALPVGVYYYVVRLDEKTAVSGSVTILR